MQRCCQLLFYDRDSCLSTNETRTCVSGDEVGTRTNVAGNYHTTPMSLFALEIPMKLSNAVQKDKSI